MVNNDKGQSICLRNEIKEVKNKIGELNNQQTKKLEERYEAKILLPVKPGDCIIM